MILQILDDASWSPSGGNRQPWKVVLLEPDAAVELRKDFEVRGWTALFAELWSLIENLKKDTISTQEAHAATENLVNSEGLISGKPWAAVIYYDRENSYFTNFKKIVSGLKYHPAKIRTFIDSVTMMYRINPRVQYDSVVCFMYSVCLSATNLEVASCIQYTYNNWQRQLREIFNLNSSGQIVGIVWLGSSAIGEEKSSLGRTRNPVEVNVIKRFS